MFWFALLIWAITTVAYEIIRPKPTFENARPAGLGDFSFPTATEGRAVPIVWGRVKVGGPNLLWYGDFRKEERKENVSTGMFSSEDVVIGYRYYIGLAMALCHGEIDSIGDIWVNDKRRSGGASTDGATIGVYSPSFWGGEEHGSGGLNGLIRCYMGTKTQTQNAYLAANTGTTTPAYRGTAYAVWEVSSASRNYTTVTVMGNDYTFPVGGFQGWIGNSSQLAPFAFEVNRVPNGLNLDDTADVDGNSEKSPCSDQCNPMNVLYEILTDSDWGLGISSGDIDTTNFQACAATLYDEGNGFGMVIDSAMEVTRIIDEVQRQIDGSLFFNRGTGQWQCKLARDDYVVGDLDIFDETNISKVEEFTRQTWEETTNQVRVQFVDSNDNYKTTFGFAQDPANMDMQGQTVQSDITYPGCKDGPLANQLAGRDLRALSYPLGKVKFKVDRSAWALRPGSTFKFSWDRLGISEMVFRVVKISYGTLTDSTISVFAIQDIFAASTGLYSDPIGSGWTEDTVAAPAYASSGDTIIFEAPKQLLAGSNDRYPQRARLYTGCRYPGGGTMQMQVWHQIGTSSPPSGDYFNDMTVSGFLPVGQLDGALAEYGPSATRPDNTTVITVDEVDDLAVISSSGDESLVEQMINIVLIDDEFIGYQVAADIGGNQWSLTKIHRGLFHTAPTAHVDNSRVWFIGRGGALSNINVYATYDEFRTQMRGENAAEDQTTEALTPEIDTSILGIRNWQPAPRDPYLNGTFADKSNVNVGFSYPTETGRSGDDARGIKIAVTPRDFWVESTVDDATLSTAYGDDAEEYDFYLDLDPDGTPLTVGPYNYNTGDGSPEVVIERNDLIKALGAGTGIPIEMNLRVIAKRTPYSTTYTNTYAMPLDGIEVYDVTQGAWDDVIVGVVNGVGSTAFTLTETGTYTFDIHYALPNSGTVEININSGGWVELVAASATSGTVAITASDSVELRWATDGPDALQYFDLVGPTAEQGYGVLE